MIKILTTIPAKGMLYILLLLAVSSPAFAQLSEGGAPKSFSYAVAEVQQSIITEAVDRERLLAEDELESMKGVPLRFGYAFTVNQNMQNSGTWTTLPDGGRLWRLRVHSPGAFSINFTFNDFWLPTGGKMYIYNQDRSYIIGAFTERNNKEDGYFATGLVPGSDVTIEYYEPAEALSPGIIQIENIVHGYRNFFKTDPLSDDFGTSGSCNINVNCDVGAPWANEIRSVAMILTSGGTRWCTGSMVNNVRQDLTPYFLTANHCLNGGQNTWVFMFRYESPNCSIIDGPTYYTLSGSTLKASNSASDFALLLLNEAVPDSYQVHYNGWDARDIPADSGVGIHHPDGDIKKISFVGIPFQHNTWSGTPANSHWRTVWRAGVTEPGSSGSPIYSNLHRVVGQLHGGPSSCTASDKSDLYGKFSFSWNYGTTPSTRAKDWLDPDNTGALFIDGWDVSMGNPDTVAPSAVTNLASQSVSSNAVTLTWTAPSDTSYGGVMKYIGKYSTSPITDTNSFNNATNLNITGAPKPAGQTETFTISGLNFSTQYYFAIRSADRWNNISVMSNVTSATTLAAPVAIAAPDSLMKVMQSNQILVDSVMLSNTALTPSTLDYTVTLENNNFPGDISVSLVPQRVTSLEVKFPRKDDAEPTGFSIEGQGGPDAGGYKWIDSDEPNGPAFEWNDIATTGTELTNWLPTGTFGAKDEGYSGPVAIPFQFKYYDIPKTQLFVSSNGAILFAAPTANMFTNAQIPTAAAPNDMLAPFWDDLDGTNGGNVYYKAEGNRLIIQYNNWPRYSTTGSALTFQVVLYSNGRIMFYYKTMTSATMNSATIGIENGDGSTGLSLAYNSIYAKNNHAVKFSADPEWLSTNSMGGSLTSGNSAAIRLEMRSEDYPPGQYRMEVKIASNDPVKPLITVPVNLLIGDVPVELTQLTAAAQGNTVTLNWSTATETNNKGFRVERSTRNSGWISAGYLAGKGNTAEISTYQFTERNLNSGVYTYRLVQEDYDGTVSIYTAPEVTVDRPEVYSLSQNYPNPFNPATSISFTLPEAARVTLTVYSTLGEQVMTILSNDLEAGYHKAEFDASQLTSGTYIYTIRASAGSKTFTDSKKMILIK